jgi:hypothetical protein
VNQTEIEIGEAAQHRMEASMGINVNLILETFNSRVKQETIQSMPEGSGPFFTRTDEYPHRSQ